MDPMAKRITDLDNSVNRSIDCLPSASREYHDSFFTSETSLRSPPHWHQEFLYEEKHVETSGSEISLSTESIPPAAPSTSLPSATFSRGQKVKNLFMKRAKSIALFSLKLKEKRAQEAEQQRSEMQEKIASKQKEELKLTTGGELSSIPLEKLICVDGATSNFQSH